MRKHYDTPPMCISLVIGHQTPNVIYIYLINIKKIILSPNLPAPIPPPPSHTVFLLMQFMEPTPTMDLETVLKLEIPVILILIYSELSFYH